MLRFFSALSILLISFFIPLNSTQFVKAEELSRPWQEEAVEMNSDSFISVKYFTENKKVIPLCYSYRDLWVTSIKLPDVVISNCSEKLQTLHEIEIMGRSNKQILVSYKLRKDDVAARIERTGQTVNSFRENEELERLMPLFGKMYIPEKGFSSSAELNPSESICIPLSRILYFHYIGRSKVDDILLNFMFKQNDEKKLVAFPVKLTPYENKGSYIFPLKGSLCLVSLPTNFVEHRMSTREEFALDILDMKLIEDGSFSSSSNRNPTKLSDFFIFHRDVIAVGDGTVVETGERFPESRMSDPIKYSNEYFQNLRKELTPKIGFKNFVHGNYIVIDHHNGEFSFYGHLSEGTIQVKEGDQVKKGEIIAQVGNTGNSSEPHLHFHLMDSPDILEANGLPLMFENIPLEYLGFDITKSNSLISSEYFYIHIVENDGIE